MDMQDTQIPTDDERKQVRVSMVYNPGETLFGAVAERCLSNGWTIIPQERGDKRISSKIDGSALKWGPFIKRMPTLKEIQHWARQAPNSNGAIMMGKPSGNVFCFDIDVLDVELSLAIQDCATEKLGYTRFARQGQKPKIALFYRVEREEDLPKNAAHRFESIGGGVSEDLLEIQARGKLVTGFGYHHKTDRYFEWEGPQPTNSHTSAVPLVRAAQIDSFIEAVKLIRPFHKSARGDGIVVLDGDASIEVTEEGWTIPRIRGAVDPQTGLISDGRKLWASDFVFALVRHNPEFANASPSMAIEVALRHAESMLDLSKPIALRDIIVEKMHRDIGTLRSGGIKSFPKTKKRADGKVVSARKAVLPTNTDAALWHLPTADKRLPLDFEDKTAPDPVKAAQRALVLDRTEIAATVAAGVDAALDSFFAEVYEEGRETITPVNVLDAPTGAGKTTRTIRYIVDDPRTRQWDDAVARGETTPGPILFTLPTYNNIEEVRQRAVDLQLDPSLSDEDLAAQAAELGLMSIEHALREIEQLRVEARTGGLTTLIYEGKKAAGCKFPDKLDALQEAGVSSSGLCRAKGMNGEADKYCPFYDTCKAIQQKALIQKAHVVFLPHAFLNLSIPEDLSRVRAVIADERTFTGAVHTTQMHLDTLRIGRKLPPLTKKERQRVTEGIVGWREQQEAADAYAQIFVQDRDEAAEVAEKALREGKDPAAVLADYKVGKDSKLTGADLVRSALRVCGGASTRNMQITPDMSDEDFADLLAKPNGKEIGFEHRFWRIIDERIGQLVASKLPGAALNPFLKKPKQSREQRLQYRCETTATPEGQIESTEFVRLSWRTDLNWSGAPLMLLDASANERIIGKVFSDRKVRMHKVTAPENMRVVLIGDRSRSSKSLKPVADVAKADAWSVAQHVAKVRSVETYLAAVHGNGWFLTGMAKTVRAMTRLDYVPPANVDDLHFGAERGLNFAESHLAALAIGRLELPVWVLDGMAAAMGYDDDEELVLLDPRGDGTDADGNPLKPNMRELVFPMRDGSDVTIKVAMAPDGTWQRLVQIQYREESLRQFAGRLRPVYRGDTTTVYLMSQVVPEGLIIDDIICLDDLLPNFVPLLDAARMNAGILDPQRLQRERPDLGSLDQFAAWFTNLPAELKANYHSVRVSGKTVAVPAHYADPLAVVAEWYPDCEIHGVIRAAVNSRVAPADVRPVDAIETMLGSREERAVAETKALDRAKKWLRDQHKSDTNRPTYLDGNGQYHVGVDKEGRPVRLPLSAIAMLTRPDKVGTNKLSDLRDMATTEEDLAVA